MHVSIADANILDLTKINLTKCIHFAFAVLLMESSASPCSVMTFIKGQR